MDIALSQGVSVDLTDRIKRLTDMCRISKIEKMLSDCLENMPNNTPLDYIGELNKNDVMG